VGRSDKKEEAFDWIDEHECEGRNRRHEEAIGFVPKGLKKGSAACRWMDGTHGWNVSTSTGSMRVNEEGEDRCGCNECRLTNEEEDTAFVATRKEEDEEEDTAFVATRKEEDEDLVYKQATTTRERLKKRFRARCP